MKNWLDPDDGKGKCTIGKEGCVNGKSRPCIANTDPGSISTGPCYVLGVKCPPWAHVLSLVPCCYCFDRVWILWEVEPSWRKWETGLEVYSSASLPVLLCFLVCRYTMSILSSCCRAFSAVMDCALKQWEFKMALAADRFLFKNALEAGAKVGPHWQCHVGSDRAQTTGNDLSSWSQSTSNLNGSLGVYRLRPATLVHCVDHSQIYRTSLELAGEKCRATGCVVKGRLPFDQSSQRPGFVFLLIQTRSFSQRR